MPFLMPLHTNNIPELVRNKSMVWYGVFLLAHTISVLREKVTPEN